MNKSTIAHAAQQIAFALIDECKLPAKRLDDVFEIAEREIRNAEMMPIRERQPKGKRKNRCSRCGEGVRDSKKDCYCKSCRNSYMSEKRRKVLLRLVDKP